METFLEIFLLADLFVAGTVCGLAAHYAFTHFGKRQELAHDPQQQVQYKDSLPAAVKERLLQDSQARFQSAVNRSSTQLEQDLESTAGLLDKLVKRLGAEIIGDELERYRTELAALRKQAQADMKGVGAEVTRHQAELEKQMAEEIAAEKQRLLEQIDTKLADAVGTFLLETLQHNIDLGAQESYLIAMLEEHKAEFASKVGIDGSTAK